MGQTKYGLNGNKLTLKLKFHLSNAAFYFKIGSQSSKLSYSTEVIFMHLKVEVFKKKTLIVSSKVYGIANFN